MTSVGLPRTDLILISALTSCAGAALVWWGASPFARWLDHGSHPHGNAGPELTVAIFSLAWLLMTVATMLPTALPLLSAFARVSVARPRRQMLTGAVIGGFLAVWSLAGLVAAVLDLWIRDFIHGPWLHAHTPLVLAGTLGIAGTYQLSGLAARCRRGCRSPMGFLGRHWTGESNVVHQSLAIGVDYGRSCLGCCAPLMVVMLIVGMGNLGWMYLLAVVAALQKHAPWGERLALAVGAVLLMAGAAVAVAHVAA